ncbi:hypothetical protein [Reyranella sp.]|uniref:hypothetical protein n=1 Tax=Reyranella sp. TaxID=1929291 RepID=UPI003D119929
MSAATITIFPTNKGTSIDSVRSMTLAELETVIRMVRPATVKDQLPLLKFATFGDQRSPGGSLRHDANTLSITGCEADYDGGEMPMADAVALCTNAGIEALFYTSASHTPEKPRWRVLCPLAAPITGTENELRERRAHWVGVLNAILGGTLKGESFALSQTFYFGAIAGRPAPEIVRLAGTCIDKMRNPPEPVMLVSARSKAPSAATVDDAADDWPSLVEYADRSAHLLACVRKALLVKKLSPPTIRKLFADHPHALDQSDPARAVNRAIERVLAGQPPAGDVLEGMTDSRVVALVRPHVEAGAVLVPSDDVPHSVAARITLRALRDRMYSQDGHVVEVARTPEGVSIQPVRDQALASRVDDRRQVLKVHFKNGRHTLGPSRMPVSSAAVVLASAAVREELREIRLVLKRPIAVEHSGRLQVLHPGFNDGPGIYVTAGEAIPNVAFDVAKRDLLALLDGYQFASAADHSRAVAALVLPALALGGMLSGNKPMLLIEANEPQGGKTKLAKAIATTLGERQQAITQRTGGVGSLDESISEALLRGAPCILLDNFRGHLDSPHLEAIQTAGNALIGCRVPHRSVVWLPVSNYLFTLTSNGLQLTEDQSNRVLVVRIVRRPDGYEFPEYSEGGFLEHMEANPSHYAGCVLTVVRHWFDAGKPRNPVQHAFFETMGVLDWIVREIFGMAPLLDEHRTITARLASPDGGFIRSLALEVERQQRLGRWVLASSLVDTAKTAGLAPNGGWPESDDESNKLMGRVLAKAFAKSEVLDYGHLHMRRAVGQYDHKPAKRYCVWRLADGPPPPYVDDEAPL